MLHASGWVWYSLFLLLLLALIVYGEVQQRKAEIRRQIQEELRAAERERFRRMK